jgi:hypothetical protein
VHLGLRGDDAENFVFSLTNLAPAATHPQW